MRIAIMGSGGVGGYFGAKLALAGNDVTFIARGPHLETILKDGLKITTDDGEMLVHPAQATDDPSSMEPVDAVLFCTKLYDTQSASELIKPIVGPDTIVVTVQNGISGADMIAEVLGTDAVLPGSTYIISHLTGPGHITHMGSFQRIIFGERDGTMTNRGKAFEKVCADAGIDVEFSDRVEETLWQKFVPLTVMSGMTSVTRLPNGPIMDDPGLLGMMENAVDEVVAVGRAKGINLADDMAARVKKTIRQTPYETKSSMLVDLERGKPLEVPWLSGTVAKLGEELAVPTPTHKFIATVLGPHANGNR